MEVRDANHVVGSEARRRVHDLIVQRPGLTVSELARATSTNWTAAAYHVGQLARAGLIRTLKSGRSRLLFPTSMTLDVVHEACGLLAESSCVRVAQAIIEHPGRRVWEICEITNMSERAVYHHVKRLVDSGLVTTAVGRSYRGLCATPLLHGAVANRLASKQGSSARRFNGPRR